MESFLSFLPPEYYTPGMIGIRADGAVLVELLAECFPALGLHINGMKVSLDLVAFKWLMQGFIARYLWRLYCVSGTSSFVLATLKFFLLPLWSF